MKIEPGKEYTTRTGDIAYIVGIAPPELYRGGTGNVWGILQGNFQTWTMDGKGQAWVNDERGNVDLIAPWPEGTIGRKT